MPEPGTPRHAADLPLAPLASDPGAPAPDPGAGLETGREPERETGLGPGLDRVVALIPALNEEASLPGVLSGLLDQGISRVVVVDNGSTDRTAQVARAGGAHVVHEPRRGYGMACLTGLHALALRPGGPPHVVLFLDGDQSDDPSAVLRILGPVLRGEADLVIGRRHGVGDAPPRQRLGTALVSGLARLLFGTRLGDLGPFRAMGWETLQALEMDDRSWGWTLQMQLRAHRMGCRVVQVPVERRPRAAGTSKISGSFRMSVRVGMRMLWTLVRERVRPPSNRAGPEPRSDLREEATKLAQ